MIIRLWLLVSLLISAGVCPITATSSDHPIRVLILSGKNNHDWRQTTPMIVRVLEGSGRFTVRVLDDPSLCTSGVLKDVDVILSNWTNFPSKERVWGDEAERAILGFVRTGKGFVIVHAASACFPSCPEFQQLCGATWGEGTGHGAYGSFNVSIADTAHPITLVLSAFTAEDELWHRMSRRPDAHVLCMGFSDTARGGTGAAEPVAYSMAFGQGRSFNLVLGHDAGAMRDPYWKLLMLRGTEWAATGDASIEIPYDVRKAVRDAVRDASPRWEQLRECDRLVQCSSRNPALRRELASTFATMLAPAASLAWKKHFCAWLSLVGGDAEVPALARLLDDPKLGFAARGALERIKSGAASDALRGAAHVVSSPSVPRPDSLLRRADVFVATGNTSAARSLYETLNTPTQPSHIRATALIGLIRCRDDRARSSLLGSLTNGDDAVAAALVQVLRDPDGRTLAPLVSGHISKLSERRRAQVLYAIADLGERGAINDMYAALGSRQPLLRRAGLYGIARLGDASSVVRLCDAMKGADPAQRAEIRDCLSRLQDTAVDERLCSAIGSRYPAAVNEQIIAALAARDARSAVPTLVKTATAASGTTRDAAFDALGSLADGTISADLIRLLKSERNAASRSALVRCLAALALRDRTPDRVCDAVLTALPGSSSIARASMFQVLGRCGGAGALQALRLGLTDADPAVQRSAIRALSAWADSAPLDDLFAFAHSQVESALRALAMQGAVGLLEKCRDLQEDGKVTLIERELGRATSREDETMLISTVGKLSNPKALRLAASRLGRTDLAGEVALAVAGIAGRMSEKNVGEAQGILTNSLQSVQPAPVEARLRTALDDLQLQTGQRKIRVAIVTGGHPFDEEAFPGLFSPDTGITCTYVPQKDDSELFEETANWPYDVIVLYNLTRKISDKRQQNLLRLLDAGVGLLSLHHVSAAFSDWCEFPKIIGCRYLLAPTEYDGARLEPSTYRHDVDIPVHIADSGHAVTAGVHDLVVRDETYHGCQFEPDNHLLLTTTEPTSDVPLAWTRQYRQARVFHCQLGHGPGIFQNGQFRRLIAQAIRWCAEGRREQVIREAQLRRDQQ